MFYLSDIISNQRISDFYIYCLDKDKIKPIQDNIHFINRPLSNDNCGHISKAGFTCNLKTFSEAQKFNTCLYKKISFGRKGEIKSCPSLPTSFGNVQSVKIKDVLFNKNFNKFWDINKDMIAICKDCEFRYVCTDCRAFISIPNDIYSKPLKCGYDPYSGSWSNWENLPSSLQGIEYYGFDKFTNPSRSIY